MSSDSLLTAEISREAMLLVCCARTVVTPGLTKQIQSLVRQDIDWAGLMQMAHWHGLLPLLYHNLQQTVPEDCPASILDQLKTVFFANALRNTFLARELLKLLRLFEAQQIPVIPYKGPILAASVYQNLALRAFSDLDILVHTWDYHFTVNDLLAAHGWCLCSDYGWERGFLDPSGKIVLDVHEGITHRDMPYRLSFDRTWKRCIRASMCDTNVRTCSPPDLLLILCVQLSKDVAANKIQLSKICDIAELVRNHPDIDWHDVLREARRLGALGMLHIGLRTATDLFGLSLPKEVLQKSQVVPTTAALVRHVKECVFQETTSEYSRPELLSEVQFFAEVRERRRDRIPQSVLYAITPNIYDYAFVRLPRALFCLYSVIRPVRLLCKYGGILLRRILRVSSS